MEISIPELIKLIAEQAERNANRLLRRLDITSSQLRALLTIEEAGEPIPEKRLEEQLHISQPSTVGLVRRMEGKELITTTPSPRDRRSILLELTPKGKKICQESKQDMIYGQNVVEQGLSEEEKCQLRRILGQIYQNLSKDEERGNYPEW